MSPPSPPSPPVISRQGREEHESRTSSRSHHRTARDYRASRSRSRGRGGLKSRSSDLRHRSQRSRSGSRSRDHGRYHSSISNRRRSRHERSRSKSRLRIERRRRNSNRSRSRSYSKSHRNNHKSRSRSNSRSRRRTHRSKSRSRDIRGSRSQSNRRHDEHTGNNKQPNVIVLSTESYKDSLKSGSSNSSAKTSRLSSVPEENSQFTTGSSSSTSKQDSSASEPAWKTTKTDSVGVYSNLEPDAPIDKEKIHKEIEEKLRIALAREGKVYPYPKPEPSHPVFANDGSFLEIFKKMQQQQTFVQQQVGETMQIHAVPTPTVAPAAPVVQPQPPPPPQLPIFGRRRGGKILKTGVVAKPKAQNDTDNGDVKDFWSIYLREVKKYKSTACESDSKTRPLVR